MNTFNDASSNALFERIIENHNATTIILDESEVYDDDYHVDDTVDDTVDDDNIENDDIEYDDIEYDEDYEMDYEMDYEIESEQQHINLTVESNNLTLESAVPNDELDEEFDIELDNDGA